MISLQGTFSYQTFGDQVTVNIERVQNQSTNTTTGTLRFELWALSSPYSGFGSFTGFKLAEYTPFNLNDGRLAPGSAFTNIQFTENFIEPPDGTYFIHLFVSEFTGASVNDGFSSVDFGVFSETVTFGDPFVFVPDDPSPTDPFIPFDPVDTPTDPFNPPPTDTDPFPTNFDTPPLFDDPSIGESIFGDRGDNVLRGTSLSEKIAGRAGDDRLIGGAGDDTVLGAGGNDTVIGGGGDDTVKGGGGDDLLRGGGGADKLAGGGGDDRVLAGGGDDTLLGGGGNDRLIGGGGDDTMTGGGGFDVFVIGANKGDDVIQDYKDISDFIEISSGASGFENLVFSQSGSDALILLDGATVVVKNVSTSQLNEEDFIF